MKPIRLDRLRTGRGRAGIPFTGTSAPAEAAFDEARGDLMHALDEAAGNSELTSRDGRTRGCVFMLPCGSIVGLQGDAAHDVCPDPIFSLDPRTIIRVVA